MSTDMTTAIDQQATLYVVFREHDVDPATGESLRRKCVVVHAATVEQCRELAALHFTAWAYESADHFGTVYRPGPVRDEYELCGIHATITESGIVRTASEPVELMRTGSVFDAALGIFVETLAPVGE